MDDKIFEYFQLKELHYQNQLSHYIYRNTYLASIRRREANFWRIAQIPALILTVTNLGVFYLNVIWGFITLLITVIATVIIILIAYNYRVKNKNKQDLKLIKLTNCMINLRYLTEEINLIKEYNIPVNDLMTYSSENFDVVNIKIKQFKRYILKDLDEIWTSLKFNDLDKKEINTILNRIDMNIDIFLDRLKLYKLFSKNHQIKEVLINLDKLIKSLKMK